MTTKERDDQISKMISLLESGSLFGFEVQSSIKSICNEWAKQKCKEQRDLCYKEMRMYPDIEQGDIDEILSAPEPNFD